MSLDEQTRAFIKRTNATPAPPPGGIPLARFRAAVEAFRPLGFEREELAEVREVTCPDAEGRAITMRLYRPPSDGPSPAVIWAHGGSWVRVTIDLLDSYFRYLARRSGCAILAVDYDLAPESQFPVAIEQLYAVALWMRKHGEQLGCDTDRLAIAGESSGGNLAAAVAQLARERAQTLFHHQLLVVPVLDALFESPSWQALGRDYLLTREQLEWALRQYAPSTDRRAPLLSPLHARDLAGLPPATIIVGEFDPLRDEGLQYAQRLAVAGVEVQVIDIDGLIHHAIMAPKALPRGRQAVTAAADALASALDTAPPLPPDKEKTR